MKVNIEIISDNKLEEKTINCKRKNVNRVHSDFKKVYPKSYINFSWDNGSKYIHEKLIISAFRNSSDLQWKFDQEMENDFKKIKGKLKW